MIVKNVLVLSLLLAATHASQIISNETTKPMLCEVNYNAEYNDEIIHGIKQRVKLREENAYVKILLPHESLTREAQGTIKCYNEEEKIIAYNENSIQKTNEYTLQSHLTSHEMFNIASYINEDRIFVDTKYGISKQCYPYKGGEYCKKGNGLDIVFNKEKRVAKLFIYGSAVNNGRAPFEVDSLFKIKVGSESLGLWVNEKNKKLISKKPDIETSNVIIWKNPAPYIKYITMIAQKGYLNPQRNYFEKKDDKPEVLQDTLEAIEIEYILDDNAYESYQKNRPPLKQSDASSPYGYKTVQSVPRKAKSTWGKQLNPKNIVPLNKFKAFYINTKKPDEVIASEVVEKVSVNYPYDKFHGIKSEDFGGYWVGDFTFEKETKRVITISQSWSKARIIIDGTVIFEDGKDDEVSFTFSKGKHRIEIEYINNWHTTDFKVSIQPKAKIYTVKELKKELSEKTSKKSKVLYAGVYESKRKDQSITLNLAKQSHPVILFLYSANPVEWVIDNANKVKIEAIVYSASKPGAEIKGDIPSSIHILPIKERFGSYSMEKKCSCHGTSFHCDGSSGLKVLERIKSFTDKEVIGFSTKYGTEALLLPVTQVNKEWYRVQEENEKQILKQKKECQKQIDPSFEKIFENSSKKI